MTDFLSAIPAELWAAVGALVGALFTYLGTARRAEADTAGVLNASLADHLARQDARIKALEAAEDEARAYERLVHRAVLDARTVVHRLDRVAERQAEMTPPRRVKLPDTTRLVTSLEAVEAFAGRGGAAREPPKPLDD